MKKLSICILLLHLIVSSGTLKATNPISEAFDSSVRVELEKENKRGFFSKVKHFFQEGTSDLLIKRMAIAALVIGVISLPSLYLLIFGWWVLLAGVLAIIADFLAVLVLVKTHKERKKFRLYRVMAVVGLIFALLTGLIPLGLLFIIISG